MTYIPETQLYKFEFQKSPEYIGTDFYYSPKGYRGYIKFSKTCGDTMGVPQHHQELPSEAYEDISPTQGTLKMVKFLDNCFGG